MTTTTTIEVFQKAAELGLKLGFEPSDTMTVEPARLCPPDFASVLKAHKPALLTLLHLPFVLVFSQILGETILFCEDEDTKAALVELAHQSGASTPATICGSSASRTALNHSRKPSSGSFRRSNGPLAQELPNDFLRVHWSVESQGYWLCAISAAAL